MRCSADLLSLPPPSAAAGRRWFVVVEIKADHLLLRLMRMVPGKIAGNMAALLHWYRVVKADVVLVVVCEGGVLRR